MIIKFKIKNIVRADYNPRIMPDVEMQSLIQSITAHGFIEPIVLNENKDRYGVLIGGHQRVTAIEKVLNKGQDIKNIEKDIDGDWTIPSMLVDLPLEAEKQLNIGLNKIHGRFDEDKLYSLIYEMKESSTLPTTGFREDEVSRILDRNMEDDDEEDEDADTVLDEPKSKAGEIYELGPHRLICGDCTDPQVYVKLFGDLKPDMIWSYPPYNVAYKAKGEDLKAQGKQSIMNDDMTPEAFKDLINRAFEQMFRACNPGTSFYICSGWESYPQFMNSMLSNGFYHSSVIIWVKPSAVPSFMDYKPKHEWIAKAKKPDLKTAESIIYGWKEGTHMFFGDNEFDVWEMPRKSTMKYLHPTEKPDWLPMRAIRNSTKRGGIILDPFSGSGSVMAACEKTGRRAFMIELDPKFCDVIRARYKRIVNARLKEYDVEKENE